MADHVRAAFSRSVEEGHRRLSRSSPALLATGALGGIDLGIGVFALLVVRDASGSALLGALAFSIGFIALTLAASELFTENFLVPVTAVVARRSTVRSLMRLWAGTAMANVVGGWVFTGVMMSGFPELGPVAAEVGSHYVELGIGWRSFAAGIIGGAAITLMTWMERGSDSMPAKLLAVITIGFLLAAGPMNHAVVSSLEMFAALHAGAPFGYSDWLAAASWGAAANMVGGIGLVTVLRLIQVGRAQMREEQARPVSSRTNVRRTPVRG